MSRKRPAFTLLELLTVMAIMGMLIAILVPSLSAARRHAKAHACLANLSGIGKGFVIYLNENDDQFPPVRLDRVPADSEVDYINETGRKVPRWQWFIETDMGPVMDPVPYQYAIRSDGYFDDETYNRRTMQYGTKMAHSVFTCPGLKDEEYQTDIRDGAYGYNYQYLGNTRQDRTKGRWDNFSVGLNRVRSPANTLVVADSRGAARKHGKHSFMLDPPRLATERDAERFGPATEDISPRDKSIVFQNYETFRYSPVEARHGGLANAIFADSHGDSMSLRELGYQISEDYPDAKNAGVPDGTALPVIDPTATPYKATNKLWTGDNNDFLAAEQHAESPNP